MRDETMSNSTTAPLIEIRNLWRHYPAGEEQIAVLKGVDLTIERGEMVRHHRGRRDRANRH